jgi:CHAT domain-containing protein
VFLPIHTAGVYSQGNLECCSDYVVSSYTPTLSALRRARENFEPITRESLVLLAAGAFETIPSLRMPLIKGVKAEITDVARLVRATDHIEVLEYGQTSAAKIHEVVEALSRADIVHLACHGMQDREDPLNSGFCLGDGKLTVSKLMEIPLDRAFLAFLSACETAKGDKNQPDQAIHLAAAMLFCGFRSIVATMWFVEICSNMHSAHMLITFRSIWDNDGPAVARVFYKALLAERVIDADAVAYALDEAVSELRSKGVSPSRWAPFIHVGA